MKLNKIAIIVLFSIILTTFGSLDTSSADTKNLIGPPVDCSGKGLPPSSHIQAFESVAWNSGGRTLRDLIISSALAQGVHPALVAAHATAESSMGQNNKCTDPNHATGQPAKSALTGCGWPPSCASGCGCSGSSVWSDAGQIKCTAEVDRKAYIAALGGPGYSVYGNCQKYKGNEEALWNCIFCTYVHGFLDEQNCAYKNRMLEYYCQWSNYLGGDYTVKEPEEEIEIPEGSSGAYEVEPSFKAEGNFVLNYQQVIDESKELMDKMSQCSYYKDKDEEGTANDGNIYYEDDYPRYVKPTYYKKQEQDLDRCLEKNLPGSWEIDCEQLDEEDDEIFMFCVPTGYSVKIYNEEINRIEEVDVKIKFALQFEPKERTKAVFEECQSLEGYGTGYDKYKCVYDIECTSNLMGYSVTYDLFELDPDSISYKPEYWSAEKINAVCDSGKVCCEYHYYRFG
jgi:hypothetical protein